MVPRRELGIRKKVENERCLTGRNKKKRGGRERKRKEITSSAWDQQHYITSTRRLSRNGGGKGGRREKKKGRINMLSRIVRDPRRARARFREFVRTRQGTVPNQKQGMAFWRGEGARRAKERGRKGSGDHVVVKFERCFMFFEDVKSTVRHHGHAHLFFFFLPSKNVLLSLSVLRLCAVAQRTDSFLPRSFEPFSGIYGAAILQNQSSQIRQAPFLPQVFKMRGRSRRCPSLLPWG